MDNEDNINRFANILQNRNSCPSSLYDDKGSNVYEEVKVNDVLKTISKQLMAIKNADRVRKDVRRRDTLAKHKCELLPLTSISLETPLKMDNVETQCLFDTQMMDFIKNAEALVDGQKQHIDKSLCQGDRREREDIQEIENCKDDNASDVKHMNMNASEEFVDRQCLSDVKANNDNYQIYATGKGNERRETEKNVSDICRDSELVDVDTSKSPILSKAISTYMSPRVCTLKEFDEFETLAASVVNEVANFEDAKRIINTKLKTKFLQTHTESVVCDRDNNSKERDSIRVLSSHFANDTQYSFDVKSAENDLEDRILFDSDDDKDDFPLTRTEPKVPDRTMYVGFQTAGNRSIRVLADSFRNARRVFDDVSKMVADNVSIECDLRKDQADHRRDGLPDLKLSNTPESDSKTAQIDVHDTEGSKITNKQVKYEHVNIDNANKIITEHIDEHIMREFEINIMPCDNESFDSTSKITNKRKNDTHSVKKIVDEKYIELKKSKTDIHGVDFVAFHTASNKRIKISEHAFTKTKNIFDNIDVNIENDYNKPVDLPKMIQGFVGFKTANNENITVSEKAMSKTRNIFDNIDKQILPNRKDDSKLTSLRRNDAKTDSYMIKHTIIAKEEENLECSRNRKIEFPLNTQNSNKNGPYSNQHKVTNPLEGFKTSNQNVSTSHCVLEKSKKIFHNIEIDINDKENGPYAINNKAYFPLKTANDKPIIISQEESAKTKDAFQDINRHLERDGTINENELSCGRNKAQNSTFKGFTTASNKPVTLSEEALSKSKKIFQDITDCMENETCINSDRVQSRSNVKFVGENIDETYFEDNNKSLIKSKQNCTKSQNISEINGNDLKCKEENHINDKLNFLGFQTASNKCVKISKEALIKTKNIFDNIEVGFEDNETRDKRDVNHYGGEVFVGFRTASKKSVKISEDALLRSKKIFEDIDFNKNKDSLEVNFNGRTNNNKKENIPKEAFVNGKNIFEDPNEKNIDCDQELKNNIKSKLKHNSATKNIDNNKPKLTNEVNIITENDLHVEDFFNTEVIKNFDDSLHTEVSKVTPKSKRSGSPILSCPRAKKKKFEPPKSINKNIISDIKIEKEINVYVFDENYKKNKKYNLKDLSKDNTKKSNDIDPYVLSFNFDTLLRFRFDGDRNDIDSDSWGTDKIQKYFTGCVNRKIIPDGWMENHMRLIIWKLISYEIFYGKCMKYACSVKNVLQQLKYRYDRELYNVQRPALRKVLEKDDVSTKLMILCVANIYVDGVSVRSATNDAKNAELLLTDGWYCVKSTADRMIDGLIADGKITVGTKLAIHGAELVNCDQGISPWEDTGAVRLKISGNGTRRARWDARLGYHGNGAILSSLTAVSAQGGKVPLLRALITRVYPTLYVERFEDGSTVTRSERLEHLHQMKYEAERQMQMEKLYEEVEKITEQESEDSEEQYTEQDNLDTGSQISRMMRKSKDPSEFKAALTSTQLRRLGEHTDRQNEKLLYRIQEKARVLIKKRGLEVTRNVVPLMKIRVADVSGDVAKAMLTLWRPNESLLEVIKEGAWIDVYNSVPTSIRYSEIQISAGRQSIFRKSKFNATDRQRTLMETLKRKCYTIKNLQSSMTSDYNEVDTFGVPFLIEPKDFDSNKQIFQNVYISGVDKNIISVNFWGGVKKFGFENILDMGRVVACVNLQKRAGNTTYIPQYRATEFTYFTKTPKHDDLKRCMDDFLAKYSKMDRIKFINDCVAIKNNYNNLKYDNVSPYRMNNSQYNTSKNKMFIESPLNKDLNLNVAGLGFESSFNELSPNTMLRKKKVNEKIAKLKLYGEPPPLNQINITNGTAIRPYKSPLISSDASASAARTNTPDNVTSNKISSPIFNRTFVKVNPVKLNFAMEETELESPPLSLD